MTEKRFVFDSDGDGHGIILDQTENKPYLVWYTENSKELCELLNELHEDNVELREAMKRMMGDLMMPR